ncbi:terminase small subunit [Roseateles chitosanitabidus]|uniref:terminase small subunit n=1 Tax=Roseateles chitosanitabidus TaxID=65048 RepID=UPI00082A6E57|nr:terminase small subunit [Roseateles chitosanitabidus]
MSTLSAPQEAFARGVASGLSQAEAYRRAYPRSQKWKADAVHQQASRLMALPQVAARVKELQGLAADEVVVDVKALLQEAKRLVFSDIRNIMKPDGTLRLPHELDADTAASVKSFKMDEYGKVEYQFWDKNSAMERLFKHKGLFELDNKQKTDPLSDLLGTLKGNVVGPVAQEGKGT